MTLATGLDVARKKALGQYFSGRTVGRLLAALADAEDAKSIIDPMVGSGDLLRSCLDVGAEPKLLIGLDVDPSAVAQAERALIGTPGLSLSVSDAFSAALPSQQFDLVITNPPYIRYQGRATVAGVDLPSTADVRSGLVAAIDGRSGLDSFGRLELLRAAHRYPGTADIAVPAWILCASLVAEGGVLAVVVPQAWLSRNYARAVRHLLDEIFDIEFIIEDGDATWFDDALVRTQLVVARRKSTGSPAGRPIVGRATRALDVGGSLVGDLRDERQVASFLRDVESAAPQPVTKGLTAQREPAFTVSARGNAGHIPARVMHALGEISRPLPERTIDFYGWQVGQGLRTGANEFFYVRATKHGAQPDPRWQRDVLPIPDECLLPAVRRQSDLGTPLDVPEGAMLATRLVYFRGWVAERDARRAAPDSEYRVLPAAVSRWIADVALSPLTGRDNARLFPELTAVATNARRDRDGRATGFWYQLPALAPRHRPELFMARICGGVPTAYGNSGGAVVDANFLTMWPMRTDALPAPALLAILHSAWVRANLEASCTVLGGGALKVEAADVRRVALPDLSAAQVASLSVAGQELLVDGRSDTVTRAVDEVLFEALGGKECATRSRALERMADEMLRNRASR